MRRKNLMHLREVGTMRCLLVIRPSTCGKQPLPAVLKLLKAVGIEPVLIGRGRNSGYLASSLGLNDLAKDLAKKNPG